MGKSFIFQTLLRNMNFFWICLHYSTGFLITCYFEFTQMNSYLPVKYINAFSFQYPSTYPVFSNDNRLKRMCCLFNMQLGFI